ncbi:signal peptidase I [Treponema sp.]|uniref:signal peptidase I n=1 Tax=Treponema sp. TaxID=166 RepID=UPI0025E8E8EF|nr:signal peptidase I [Treponema sp.]MCR5218108.1 signal peptidase I [Treponema sp.]
MKQNIYDYSFEMSRQRKHNITVALILSISVFIFLNIVVTFFIFPVLVRSDSMSDEITSGSVVFVTPLSRSPKRGDVVLVKRLDGRKLSAGEKFLNLGFRFFTAQTFAPFGHSDRATGKESIRRILALPGDTIYMKDYVLYVKPAGESQFLSEFEVSESKYSILSFSIPAEWDCIGSNPQMEETTLGENEYFVLADNRVEAVDSRSYGPVKGELIGGKVILEYFPLNKFKLF